MSTWTMLQPMSRLANIPNLTNTLTYNNVVNERLLTYEPAQPIEALTETDDSAFMLKFATFNVAGLHNNLNEVRQFMTEKQLDICFITETWLKESTQIPNGLIAASSIRPIAPNDSRNHAGVSLMVSDRVRDSLIITTLFSCPDGESLWVRTADITFGCSYMPPGRLNDLIYTKKIEDEIQKYGTRKTILLGDYNARYSRYTGDHTSNSRGRLLFESLLGLGFQYCKPDILASTFQRSGDLGSSVVDLIFTRNVNVTDTIILPEIVAGSEHKFVSASTDGTLSESTKKKHRDKICTQKLKDIETRRLYCEKVEGMVNSRETNILLAIEHDVGNHQHTADVVDKSISDLLKNCGRQILGSHRPCYQAPKLDSPVLKKAIKLRRRNLEDFYTYQAQGFLDAANALKEIIETETQRLRNEKFKIFTTKLDTMSTCEQAKVIKAIASKRRRKSSKLSVNQSDMIRHKNFFQGTFSNEYDIGNTDTTQRIVDAQASLAEAEIIFADEILLPTLRYRPNGKAPGYSGLPNELISSAASQLLPTIKVFFTFLFTRKVVPASWKTAIIIPIPKKGDLTVIENYRPISLTENLRKCYEVCIDKYIQRTVKLSMAQGGFRPNRSCLDQAVTLHEIMRAANDGKSRPIIALLDIKKAYDSVPRPLLWQKCLNQQHLSRDLVDNLKCLYDENSSQLMINEQLSDTIKHSAGLLQGSVISPTLYSIFIDDIAESLKGSPSIRVGPEYESNILLYADDIVLIARSPEVMTELLLKCEQHSILNMYRFNIKKCEHVNGYKNDETEFQLYSENIEKSNIVKYLGIDFDKKGLSNGTTCVRAAKATAPCVQLMSNIGMNDYGGFSPLVSTRVFKSFIRSKLEYALPIMVKPTKVGSNALETIQNRALSSILGVSGNSLSSQTRILTNSVTMDCRRKQLMAKFIQRFHKMKEHQLTGDNRYSVVLACEAAGNSSLINEMETYLRITSPVTRESTKLIVDELKTKDLRSSWESARDKNSGIDFSSYTHVQPWIHSSDLSRPARRAVVLWILKKIPGKPRTCLRCGDLCTTRDHVTRCGDIYTNLRREGITCNVTRSERDSALPLNNLISNLIKGEKWKKLTLVAKCIQHAAYFCVGFFPNIIPTTLEDIDSIQDVANQMTRVIEA